jgi:type I restriction enzyme S subunit
MNDSFKTYFIRDIGKVSMCKRVLKEETFEDEEIPFYKISTFGGKADTFISRKHYQEYRDKYSFPKVGEILISAAGTIGKTVIYNGEEGYFQDSNIVWIENDETKVRNDYLYYFFQTKPWFTTHGSTITRIYNENLRSIKLTVPESLFDQKKIACVLSALDSKIELNIRINAELDAMTKTLYDYWFVQFDFPDKNGKPYKTSGGKMVWNEMLKREIPEGWEVGELIDIANITMGQSPPGESYNEVGEGMIFYQGCTDFGNRFPTVRKFTTEPTRFAKEGDILLSVRAPVGTLNISKEDCCIGRGLAALNSKDNCIAYLFGVMVNLKQIFDRRNVDGTTFGSITKDDLFSLKVIKPKKSILLQYHSIINPAFEKQNKLELENIKLTELRDWLLPMLLNGQVKVN